MLSVLAVNAQVPKKRLPQTINIPVYNHIFPSLSGDGMKMIFFTNYTNSEGFEPRYTEKTGPERWAEPEPFVGLYKYGLDHIGSFCLSYDGNTIVFSSRRSPGIGNYDIWFSEREGDGWSRPKNPGKPLNSPAHEGNPSLSPDGKTLYFMRCEKMDNLNKSNCALYVSRLISPTRWSEPERLPANINTGHETTPRILADGKTLIFASGRSGGKGKLDLYETRLESGAWTDPLPLTFINTDHNDEIISIPARGDIIYFNAPYKNYQNIFKAIIPEEFRPSNVLMLEGTVAYDDGMKPGEDILVQVFDPVAEKLITSTKLRRDGTFTLFLPEGNLYDVSVFPQKGGHTYYSGLYDLTAMEKGQKIPLDVSLSRVRAGAAFPLTTIRYDSENETFADQSKIELKRIIGFLKKNPGTRIDLGAFIEKVVSDSIPSDSLTEVTADTLLVEIEKPITEEFENDIPAADDTTASTQESLAELSNDINSDTLTKAEADSSIIEMTPADSLIALGYEVLEESDDKVIYYKVEYTYHNDITEKLAAALLQKLLAAGVPENLIEAHGYGDEWEENHATPECNYWVVLKIIP